MSIRSSIITDCVKNIREFGYSECNSVNIFTDPIYSRFFKSILEDNLGKDTLIDCAIQSLLKELED